MLRHLVFNLLRGSAALFLTACSSLEVGLLDQTPVLDPTAVTTPLATEPPAATAAPTTAPPNTDAPAPATGTLTGRVCYPSEFIPAMTAYFENVATQAVTQLPIAENQLEYSVALEPGTYTAFAWWPESEVGMGASVLVDDGASGQHAESLRPLDVPAGATVTADLCDPLPVDVRPGAAADTPPSPAGLVYASAAGVEIMDAAGQRLPLFERAKAVLSPDGAQALYVNDDDVWVVDLATGEHRNLTNTAERVEHSPQWWPARPDLVLFSSYERGREILMGPGFFPALVHTDGTGYTILFDESDTYSLAPSPDGVTVAYGLGPAGWLHNVETGHRTAFDPTQRGLDMNAQFRVPASWSLGYPVFDPTGAPRLAWNVGLFYEDGSNQISTAVFDLEAGTAHLLHPYVMPATDGFPPAARWSPDGQWLATLSWATDPNQLGLWLLRADGSGERYLGHGGSPTWSPNSRWLAWSDALGSTLATQPTGTDLYVLPRPEGSWLLDWK